MRNMSFAMTAEAILAQTKTVTRRLANTWRKLKPGDLVQPVRKAMGLKKGAKVEKLGPPIEVVRVDVETLWSITWEFDGAQREGFPALTNAQFCNMFMRHYGCGPDAGVRRIEFRYLEE